MEFDWDNSSAIDAESSLTIRDIEESFEDPFTIKLLPDSSRFAAQARYFNLGRSAAGLGVFSVYRTNGKQVRSDIIEALFRRGILLLPAQADSVHRMTNR